MRRSPEERKEKPRKRRGWAVLIGGAFASGLLLAALVLFWPAAENPAPARVSPFAGPDLPARVDNGAAPAETRPVPEPMLAIVVGDLGYDPVRDADWLGVPAPITMSILPFGPSSRTMSSSAQDRGHCVILHVPMEPRSVVKDRTEPYLLRVGMDHGEIAGRLEKMAREVPQAVGAMNHMGSAFTTDPASMDAFAEALKGRGFFFVDGATAPGSLGLAASNRAGVPALQRDVFLDDDPDPDVMRRQWEKAVSLAKRTGNAMVVCHGRRETLDVLLALLPGLRGEGVRPVTVTELMEKRPAAKRREGKE
jgi:polysaccharide deacetylase 2 family uncharacterized protein YibQ